MKLWKNKGKSNIKVEDFTVGNDRDYDIILAKYDCIGSIAHAKMLKKIGLLSDSESNKIIKVLNQIKNQVESNHLTIDKTFEDIHSKIEFILIKELGDLGKKIHAGRSRNDQVLVAMQLYLKDSLKEIKQLIVKLFNILLDLAKNNKNHLLPGYTHLQIAMPSSFGLWFSSYAEALIDDLIFINSAYKIADQNPLGSAAGYGSSFPVDRNFTTKELKFNFLKINSISAQMSRGKLEKTTSIGLSLVASTLSKLSMDICLYMSENFKFISFPDNLTTGSSIMPHKKNPDIFEIIRGKCNLLQGLPNQITLLINNLPSGYHREFQLSKAPLINGINELKSCLDMMIYSIPKVRVSKNILENDKYDHIFSVENLNKNVINGKPFREAYNELTDQINSKKYIPNKNIKHSHIGSIGNLSLDLIKEKFNHFLKA